VQAIVRPGERRGCPGERTHGLPFAHCIAWGKIRADRLVGGADPAGVVDGEDGCASHRADEGDNAVTRRKHRLASAQW